MDNTLLDPKAIGFRLRNLRNELGLSCESFAKEIGSFSVSSVRNWELGNRTPSLAAVIAICNRFGISANELVLGFCSRETR